MGHWTMEKVCDWKMPAVSASWTFRSVINGIQPPMERVFLTVVAKTLGTPGMKPGHGGQVGSPEAIPGIFRKALQEETGPWK